MVDFFGANAPVRNFLAIWVDIDSARSSWLYAHHMDVEDKRFVVFGPEPMHIVLEIGDR